MITPALLAVVFIAAQAPVSPSDGATAPAAAATADAAAPADADTPADDEDAAAIGPTLAHVKASGELAWGADAQGGAPYVFQDPMDPNHTIGFEVELADELARRLGARARPTQGPWDKLIELLHRGDFDVAMNGLEVAEEKLRICELSRPYYVAAERLTVRRGDKDAPRTMEALKGRKVGTLPGSLAERILTRAGAVVMTYDGGQDDIYKDLKLGRSDGVLLDDPITRYYGQVEPALEVVDGAFGEVHYAIAIRKGDLEMKAAVDAGLLALQQDGTLRRLYERWGLWNDETGRLFGDPVPPGDAVAASFEAWRSAVGKQPPFWERVVDRYPRVMPLFAKGALLTLGVSLLAMLLAVGLGVVLALLRSFGPLPLRAVATLYIEVVRGTPLLVQLTMIYFGLPELGVTLSPFTAGVLALGLNYAAAEAENYRAGLSSVPMAQLDAARVLGLSTWQALRHVVGPQALRVALPPTTNDFIALLKDSSLISLVTLTELTKTYSIVANSTRDHLGLGVVVALWYLAIGLPFAMLARRTERKMSAHLKRAGGR